jgi:hypothetical protein
VDAPTARQHGRRRQQLEPGEAPEDAWTHDPVDDAPGTPRRHGAVQRQAPPQAPTGAPDEVDEWIDEEWSG